MRRVALWLSVCCLVLLAAAGIVRFIILRLVDPSLTPSGWTFYTPYAGPTTSMRLLELASWVESVVFPVALLSVAAYLILADRAIAPANPTRGFEIVDR